ncbi:MULTISPECIES: hypothetical protein [Paraburkholderia]|uniref:hypothetical protein n=1 Tax=Paraburkholderia TaxID=1822464 RepID=UPI00321855CE
MLNSVTVAASDSVLVEHGDFGCVADYASARAKQLESLLLVLSGDGADALERCDGEARENVMWLLRMLAAEVGGAVRALTALPGVPAIAEGEHNVQ